MKKLVVLTALIVAVTAVAIGAASFQGPWMTADATKVSDYVPNVVDLYLPSNPTTGYSWTYEIEDPTSGPGRQTFRRQSRQPTGSA